jgi:hypothetical protein
VGESRMKGRKEGKQQNDVRKKKVKKITTSK